MLSIAKLRVGQEAYHLSGVAESLDAYYQGHGEATGVWLGGSATRLALTGDVDPADLRAVLAGLGPGWGGLTPNGETQRPHPRRVPGFDLTFKAPKSASVLYGVSDDPRVQGAVIEAGEVAMRAAIGWLEEHTVRVRRGNHNRARQPHPHQPGDAPRELVTSGVVAAGFRHRTSRAGDPLLHWHVLVANLAEGADGRWSSIVHPHLYRHMHAAGRVFQAVYRQELSVSLGVEWRPGRTVPEIAGIPQPVLDLFSKRSTEIEDWLTATGTPDTLEGRQAAVLATRRAKPEVEHGRFDDTWKTEATGAGWGPDAAEALVAWYANRHPHPISGTPWQVTETVVDEHGHAHQVDRTVDQDEWIAVLLRDDLTASTATFGIADLHAAIAARQGHGATRETIERIAHTLLASDQIIPVGSDVARWTSRELVDIEDRFIRTLHQPTTPLLTPTLAAGLGPDQAAAVTAITTTTAAVTVLVGPAGTGKTFTLTAVRDAYTHAGIPVVGAAPSARAALELDAIGVPARTLHRVLDDWRHDPPRPDTLLVVDEAGMADIRTLEAVVTRQLAAGGRVLLVGDHHQLPEVGAGGGFAYAAEHAQTVTTLTTNRRQHEPWEQQALAELRDGDVTAAVDAYFAHGRVHITTDPADTIATAVHQWQAARDNGHHPVLLAGTNATVDALNTAIAHHLTNLGELADGTTTFAGREYRTGERVVIRRNGTETSTTGQPVTIANGQLGTIHHHTTNTVTVALDDGPHVVLTDRYLQRGGHIDHAWALTTHRAQGGTWDLAIAVGTDGLYREGAYVQLSRGRHHNQLILTEPEALELHHQARTDTHAHDSALTPAHDQPPPARDDLILRVTRSHAKHLAHHDDPNLDTIDRLARHHSVGELEHQHRLAVTAEHHANHISGGHGPDLLDQAAHIADIASHLEVGTRVSPHDRYNVGVVTALHDETGTVTVHFTSDTGREATRQFTWAQLRLVDEPTHTRDLPPHAQTLVADLEQRHHQWTQLVREHGSTPGDAELTARAIQQHIDTDTHHLLATRPLWLTQLLGPRPDDVAGATTYDDTVRHIATHRAQHQIRPDTGGLGPRPHDATSWDTLTTHIAATRTWLATTDRITPTPAIIPTRQELVERLTELDAILATAPPDHRHLIGQLQAGQLTLDDTTQLLTDALTGQDDRRAWIVEHWPHVVEQLEITRALAGSGQPELESVDSARIDLDADF